MLTCQHQLQISQAVPSQNAKEDKAQSRTSSPKCFIKGIGLDGSFEAWRTVLAAMDRGWSSQWSVSKVGTPHGQGHINRQANLKAQDSESASTLTLHTCSMPKPAQLQSSSRNKPILITRPEAMCLPLVHGWSAVFIVPSLADSTGGSQMSQHQAANRQSRFTIHENLSKTHEKGHAPSPHQPLPSMS